MNALKLCCALAVLLSLCLQESYGVMKRGWFDGKNGFQYALTKIKLDYKAAQKECEGWNGKLANFGIRDRYLFKKLASHFTGDDIWIGMDDRWREGWFRWNDGTLIRKSWNSFWHVGEPDNSGNSDCVVMSTSPCNTDPRLLKDEKCNAKLYGLCELSVGTPPAYLQHTKDGLTYALITTATSFSYAEQYCKEWGGSLAVSPAVDQDVAKFLTNEIDFSELQYPEVWIGINDRAVERTFVFSSQLTNPSASEINWNPRLVNWNGKDCAAFLPKTRLIDLNYCGHKKIALCEKLSVSLDDSLPDYSCLPQVGTCNNSYATLDGSCNNKLNKYRGVRKRALKRYLPSAYDNKKDTPRGFGRLPSARDVTQAMRDANPPDSTIASNLLASFGQLLAHDLARTQGGDAVCDCSSTNPECFNIQISNGDPMKTEKDCIVFKRSAPIKDANCDDKHREQINLESAYIDASFLYGSTEAHARALLSKVIPGELIVGNTSSPNPESLPFETQIQGGIPIDCNAIHTPADKPCFAAGDPRVNEQPPLTVNHLNFLRFHNKVVRKLTSMNPHWDCEKLYQTARTIVSASTQHVTYNEFLPTILGPVVSKRFGLELTQNEFWYGYNPEYDATIDNSFTTAAFRFGHTLVHAAPTLRNVQYSAVTGEMPLESHFFNTTFFFAEDGYGSMLRGMLTDKASKYDSHIVTPLIDHLFAQPGKFGNDLNAFNIQRGRDHGLPSYLEHRRFCGLSDDLKDIPMNIQNRLLSVYSSKKDIDLFIGGISESSLPDAILGPTFACLIAYQFRDLRNGDAFWYENGGTYQRLTNAQLKSIKKSSIAQMICETSETMRTIQPLALLQPSSALGNERVNCSDIPKLDLYPWKEKAEAGVDEDSDSIWTPWLPISYFNTHHIPLLPEMGLLRLASIYRPDDVCQDIRGKELRKVKGHYQARFQCPPGTIRGTDFPCGDALYTYFTPWSDQATPNSPTYDDDETLAGSGACLNPVAIQAQTLDGVPARESGDVLEVLSPFRGLLCRGAHQINGICKDYRVRYLCLKETGLV